MMGIATIGIFSSLLAFAVATAGLIEKSPYFVTWYYCWAWWSLIVFFQSWIKIRRGYSYLYDNFSNFLFLSFYSVPFWLFFELINLRLQNWYYINLPSSLFARWFGYFIAYATVLPAILTVKSFLDCYDYEWKLPGGFRNLLFVLSNCPRPFLITGGIFLFFLTIAFPKFCFPLVWIFLIFVLDPVNEYLCLPSFLDQWKKELFTQTERFLLSGLICGVIWELLNFWAGSKWRYSLPFFNYPKVFEMPLLGYLGFLPFALECAVFIYAISGWKKGVLNVKVLVSVVMYTIISFALIDLFSVHSFR